MADGDTALVDAVDEAIDIVNNRKKWYKSTGQPYYRPWIILITDGEPNEGQDVSALAGKIKKIHQRRNMYFFLLALIMPTCKYSKAFKDKSLR